MGMDFRDLVWKPVWKMTFLGLKQGQALGKRAAHPHQEFTEVPPSRGQEQGVNHVIIIIA